MDSVISLVRLIALSGVNACKYAFVSSSKCSGLSEILSKTPGSLTTDVGLPVTIISNDVCASAKRGRRWVPPAPGNMPRFTSGRPTLLSAKVMRWWQANATSKPPPNAGPGRTATTGLDAFSILSSTSGSMGDKSPPENSLMSAPPEKIGSEEVITMALTLSSSSALFMPSINPTLIARDSALTGALCIVSVATPCCTAYSTALFSISVITMSCLSR